MKYKDIRKKRKTTFSQAVLQDKLKRYKFNLANIPISCQILNSKYHSSFESVGQILTRRLQHYTQNTFNNVDFSRNHGDIRVTWDVGGRSALSRRAAYPIISRGRSIQ